MPKVEHLLYGDRKVFTVSAFNRGVGMHLGRLPNLWVEGEVTELRRNPAWANVFLTLKDPKTAATLAVTIARRAYERLELDLDEGETVHVAGRAELFEQRAALAFRATTIERLGIGGHLVALEQLKRKLAAEGLFAPERKRRLPRVPRAVGILTGADAAARGDLVATIASRFPATRVVICETRVQGKGAPGRSSPRSRGADRASEVDVVVLSRGGGSFEDLLPFSDEAVVRAVAGVARARRLGGRPRAGHPALRPRRGREGRDPDRGRARSSSPTPTSSRRARARRRRLGVGVRARLERSRGTGRAAG